MKKYLASDLDGTLLKPIEKNAYVCKKNKDAIKVFENNVILVSGRPANFIKNVCKELNLEHTFIACNGAAIFYKGKNISTHFIPNEQIINIIEYVKTTFNEYCVILFTNDENIYSISDNPNRVSQNEQDYIKKFPKLGYKTNKDVTKINSLLHGPDTIIKLNIALNASDKHILYNYLKDTNSPLSYVLCLHSIEICAPGVSKGNALIDLVKYINVNTHDVYVIGDDNNDVSMFKTFTNSFLVQSQNNKHLEPLVLHPITTFSKILEYIKED